MLSFTIGLSILSTQTASRVERVRTVLNEAVLESREATMASLDNGQSKLDTTGRTDRLSFFGGEAHFSKRTDKLLVMQFRPEQSRGGDLTTETLLLKASRLAKIVGFQGTISESYRDDSDQTIYLTLTASVHGIQSTECMIVTFNGKSGELAGFRVYESLDYSQFKKPQVTEAQAEESARTALFRTGVYPHSTLLKKELLIGLPLQADERPPSCHELTLEEAACIENRVAFPHWVFVFVPAGSNAEPAKDAMAIAVDGRDGHAMIADHQLSLGAQKPKDVGLATPLSLHAFGVGRGTAVKTGPAPKITGVEVGLSSGPEAFIGKFDRETELLFLPNGSSWATYNPDRSLLAALKKARPIGPKFGQQVERKQRSGL